MTEELQLPCVRLLVVDDPLGLRAVEAAIARSRMGRLSLEQVSSIVAAKERLRDGRFEACLLNTRVCGEDALQLLREIATTRAEIAVVMTSPRADYELDLAAMAAGASDFLSHDELTPARLERSLRYAIKHKQLEQRLQYMAEHDPLTAVYNRRAFRRRVEESLARARRAGSQMALLFLDLVQFKPINDHYGHEIGDAVLRTLARRLLQCVRETDVVGRVGGDEFAVCLEGPCSIEGVERVAGSMLWVCGQPLRVGSLTLSVGVSVGVALYPSNGDTASALLGVADRAMYRAKRGDGNGNGNGNGHRVALASGDWSQAS